MQNKPQINKRKIPYNVLLGFCYDCINRDCDQNIDYYYKCEHFEIKNGICNKFENNEKSLA